MGRDFAQHRRFLAALCGGKAFALDACKERKARFHTEKLSFHNLLSHVDASGEGPRSAATKQNVFLENALKVTK